MTVLKNQKVAVPDKEKPGLEIVKRTVRRVDVSDGRALTRGLVSYEGDLWVAIRTGDTWRLETPVPVEKPTCAYHRTVNEEYE